MATAGMLAGAGIGLGLLLIAHGLLARPRPLAAALDELCTGAEPAGSGFGARIARHVERTLAAAGIDLSGLDADLGVAGRSREQHLVAKAAAAVGGLAAAGLLGVVGGLAGAPLPAGLLAASAASMTAAGWILPDARRRAEAARSRRAFRFALSSYLDLVHLLLAAGVGVETALADAAEAGRGWPFEQLRTALARARLAGDSPWQALRRLGADLDLPDLRELAGALHLAGSHGARVRDSLEARATAMRARDLTDMITQAEAATERMSGPAVVLVIAFVLFLGFPALHTIIGF